VLAAGLVLVAQLLIALPFLFVSPGTLRGVPGPLLVVTGLAAAFVFGPWEGAALTGVAVVLAVVIIGENPFTEPLVWLPVAVGVGIVGERVRRGDELRRSLLDALRQGLVSLVQDPEVGPLVVVSRYVPAEAAQVLAGDFYGEIQQPDGRVAMMVGDVAGHGPSAAAIATRLRAAWRALVSANVSAPETIRVLNEMLIAEHQRHRTPVTFATVCLVSVDTQLATASVLLAGHPPPILVASGVAQECDVPPCPAIGIMGFSDWDSHDVALPDGPWTLVLYTDGLVEGRSAPDGGRPLGPGRLLELLATRSSPITEADTDAILAEIEQANGGPLPDDVVFLAASPQVTADASGAPQSRLGLVRG
jgi:hypothetical protein